MSSCKNRAIVTDSNGDLWDMASPDIVGVASTDSGAHTIVRGIGSSGLSQFTILVPFAEASAAFGAS